MNTSSKVTPHPNLAPQDLAPPVLTRGARFRIGLACGFVLLTPVILFSIGVITLSATWAHISLLAGLETLLIFTYLIGWCGLQNLMASRLPTVIILCATFAYTLASPVLWYLTHQVLDFTLHGTPFKDSAFSGGLGGLDGLRAGCLLILSQNAYHALALVAAKWMNPRRLARQLHQVHLAPIEQDRAAKTFPAPPGKALIYVLRTLGKLNHTIPLFLNGTHLADLPSRTFLCWPCEPGCHTFASTALGESSLELLTEPGQTYFLLACPHRPKAPMKFLLGLFRSRSAKPFQLIPETDGRVKIQVCRLLAHPMLPSNDSPGLATP